MKFLEGLMISISFFSTLPIKIIDWTVERIRFIPMTMGFVGILIGVILYGFSFFEIEPMIKSILFIVIYTVLTGGLHNDALMDTSDAHFSRRDIDRKLEIMTDSRVGAFAVMSYVNYILLFFVTMYYYYALNTESYLIILTLFISRSLVGVMNYNLKYAKEDGLAKMYAEALKRSDLKWLYFIVLVVIGGFAYLDVWSLVIPMAGVIFYHVYKRFMYKQFRGITGDLLGTYVLLSELVMLGTYMVVKLWI